MVIIASFSYFCVEYIWLTGSFTITIALVQVMTFF